MRRTSLDRMREDLRLQLVYNTLMRYGMDVVLERTPYVGGFRHGLQTWVWRLPKGWEEPPPAVRLRMMLEELGPDLRQDRPDRLQPGLGAAGRHRRPSSPSCRTTCRRSPATRCASRSSRSWGRRRKSCTPPSSPSRSPRPRPRRCTAPSCTTAPRSPSRCSGRMITNMVRSDLGHPAERRPRGVAALGDGAHAGRLRHARAVLGRRARGARLPRRDLQRPPARRRTWRACRASTCRSSTPSSRRPRSSPRSSWRASRSATSRPSRRPGWTARRSPATRCARSSSSSRSTASSTPTRTPATCSSTWTPACSPSSTSA